MIHWRRYFAELIGTAALLCAVIGSGIMAEQLADGNTAVALLANTLATVFALYVLIETLGPVSGAHFNPVVSIVMAYRKDLARHHLVGYVIAQLTGAALGASRNLGWRGASKESSALEIARKLLWHQPQR